MQTERREAVTDCMYDVMSTTNQCADLETLAALDFTATLCVT